jgi:hypothetical protein
MFEEQRTLEEYLLEQTYRDFGNDEALYEFLHEKWPATCEDE